MTTSGSPIRWCRGLILSWLLASGGVGGGQESPVALDRLMAHAISGNGAFTFDPSAWDGDASRLPIGVFDSGVGGLTVLEALLTMDAYHNDTLRPGPDGTPDLARERFVYFGDRANMPYGNYAAEGRGDYLRELILKDAVFLLGRRGSERPGAPVRKDKPPVKAIVIACNTATAAGLEDIRAALRVWKVPVVVVGVVEAGAEGVLQARREREGEGSVAVLATVGTCASGAYPRMIQRSLGRAGRPAASVVQQGSRSLAGAIEGDPAFAGTVADTVRADVKALLEAHRQLPGAKPIDTIVLGCTHFPLALGEFESAIDYWRGWISASGVRPFAEVVAEDPVFVDPAEWTAKELFRQLASARLRLREGESCVLPEDRFYLSKPDPTVPGVKLTPDGSGFDFAYKYGREPGQLNRDDTVIVTLRASDLEENLKTLLRDRLPAVWARLGK